MEYIICFFVKYIIIVELYSYTLEDSVNNILILNEFLFFHVKVTISNSFVFM